MIFIATCINLYYIFGVTQLYGELVEKTAPNLVVIDN